MDHESCKKVQKTRKIYCELESIMMRSLNEVWDYSREQQVPLRLGAYMLAVHRVAAAIQARGVFP